MVGLGTTEVKNDRISDLVDRSAKKTQLEHPFSGLSTLSDSVFQVSIIPTAPLIAATLSQNDKRGSIGFCIDPAEGVEPVINLKHEEFPGRIIVQEPTTAISEAKKVKSDLALWSDGSKIESGSVGAAGV